MKHFIITNKKIDKILLQLSKNYIQFTNITNLFSIKLQYNLKKIKKLTCRISNSIAANKTRSKCFIRSRTPIRLMNLFANCPNSNDLTVGSVNNNQAANNSYQASH